MAGTERDGHLWRLTCGVSLGVVLAVSGGVDVSAGEWTIQPSASVEEEFTDNVNGTTSNNDIDSDFITTATAGLGVHGRGGRTNLSFNYNLSQETHRNDDELDGFRHDLLTIGDAEIWEEYVFVDARASISQEILSSSGTVTADGDRNQGTNQTQVANYSGSVTFRHGNDGWADSIATYRLSETRFLQTDAGATGATPAPSRTHEIISTLESGRRFSVLSWSGTATTSFQYNYGQFQSRTNTLSGSAEYTATRWLSLLASAGRDDIKDKNIEDDDNVSGIFWQAGARLQPGPRTQLRLEYGQRFDDQNFDADFSYEFSSLTRMSASYSVDIQTQQEALNNSLNNLIIDPDTGEITDPLGNPVDPNVQAADIIDDTFKTESFALSLNGNRGRNTFSVSAAFTRREVGAADGEEGFDKTTTLSGSFSRQLRPNASLSLSGSAQVSSPSTQSEDETTLNATATFNYNFANDLAGSLNYAYLRRFGRTGNGVTENSVAVRLSKTF